MARISFSPLIVEARGKVKDTVFSSWKGRAYIRARVTPANPNTAAQQAVRNSMSAAVKQWQAQEVQLQDAWDLYAGPYSISGYNAFVKANRAEIQAITEQQTSPVHADMLAITDLAAVSGSSSGEIDLTWTDPGQGAGYYAYMIAIDKATMIWTFVEKDTTLMSAEAYTITGLAPTADYWCYLSSEKIADDLFSASDGNDAVALA